MTLVISGLGKRFGERTLFADLNLVVQPGRFVGVSGANGAGKSTLLRIVAGLEPASAGSIAIGTEDPRPLERRDALYFMQRHHTLEISGIDFWRTVHKALSGRSPSREAVDQWLEEAPPAVRMHAQTPLDHLSLGQQRAILFYAFARQDRAVMLFDEPFAGLSVKSIDLLLNLFELVRSRYVLIVDHRPSALEAFCDHVVEL